MLGVKRGRLQNDTEMREVDEVPTVILSRLLKPPMVLGLRLPRTLTEHYYAAHSARMPEIN